MLLRKMSNNSMRKELLRKLGRKRLNEDE